RRWTTGVARGSALAGGAAVCCCMPASLPAPSDTGAASAAISSGTGTSLPSSRTSAATAFCRSASRASSKPRTLAARRSRPAADAVAHFLADQAAGDGAGDADPDFLQVGLDLPHDAVLRALAGFGVLQLDGGAEHHPVARQPTHVDHLRPGQAIFQHLDAPLDVRLLLLGGVVLGVLAQVAVL